MAARAGSGLRALGSGLAARIGEHPTLTRWLLAGPVSLLAALATMAAMPLWIPPGAAGVNHLAWPIILTPLLWAVPFFYACLEEDLVRGSLVLAGITLGQSGVVALSLAG